MEERGFSGKEGLEPHQVLKVLARSLGTLLIDFSMSCLWDHVEAQLAMKPTKHRAKRIPKCVKGIILCFHLVEFFCVFFSHW